VVDLCATRATSALTDRKHYYDLINMTLFKIAQSNGSICGHATRFVSLVDQTVPRFPEFVLDLQAAASAIGVLVEVVTAAGSLR
jgi:hypothetical protein